MAYKILYIALLLLIISCGQASKTDKESKVEAQGAIEIIEEAVGTLPKSTHLDFDEILDHAKTKELPHIESTNFDSFIDEDDYQEINSKALKLDQIYPQFNAVNRNYKAIAMFTLPINTSFNSVIVTILKSEHEMETLLINYDTKGKLIAHHVVAYDEIAEGMSQTVSRISEEMLTVNRIFWGNTREIEQNEFEIRSDGTIEKVNTKRLNNSFENFTLINSVLTNLKLDWVQVKTDLIASAPHPENAEETILVIPEIVDEGIQYFDLNSHIVIADNHTGNITHTYFESHKTNQWVSDAIELDKIQIDSVTYRISEDKTAFGVTISHFGHSRVNPYIDKKLSLFMKSGDSLIKVLSNYTVDNFGGEWDGDCNGEFVGEKKNVFSGSKKTNGYFDLFVNHKIIKTKDFKDSQGECKTDRSVVINNAVLKFNGNKYDETNVEYISYAEYHSPKTENLQIDNLHIEHAYQLGDFKIVAGHYKPVDGEIVPLDTEKDWGDRLLMLDASNNIVYKSKGFGDVYHFEPHIFKSDASDKTIIICQLAYEYPFGGEAFILENKTLKHLGTLDIEPYDENLDTYLTDVVEINEIEGNIVFTLKSEEVVLKPGSEDEVKTNKNAIYVFQDNALTLKTN